METSSLNWLFRKQSSQHSQLPPRDPHPALALFQNVLRTNQRGFLALAPSQELCGFCCRAEAAGAAWALQGLSQLPAKAAALPRALGCRGQSQPWPHSLTPRKAKSQMGPICAPITTLHPLLFEKIHVQIHPPALFSVGFSQHRNLPCTSVRNRKWSQSGAGQELGAHQGCPKQLLLKDHYSTETALSCDWKCRDCFIKCVFTCTAVIYQLLFKNYSECHFLSFPNVPLGTVADCIKMMTLNLKPKI